MFSRPPVGAEMDTPGLCLCVCVGVHVCPRTLVLLPSPSLISLHLPRPGPCLPFYPMAFGVVLLQASFSRGSREERIRMSESQILAVMATVHSSINGDEVNKTGLCLCVSLLLLEPPPPGLHPRTLVTWEHGARASSGLDFSVLPSQGGGGL